MATSAWIESASRGDSRPVGTEYMTADHLLAMPIADARREAEYRTLAARAVRRCGGEHAGELLDILGLEVS